LSTQALVLLILLTVFLVGLLIRRPSLTAVQGGKILAFFAFFMLPIAVLFLGGSIHLDYAKSTQFCLSCHPMAPYGKSLRIDDPEYLPAQHYQNNRIPKKQACFTCHTDYTMFGDVNAKLRGLKHLYIYFFEPIPQKISLYQPFNNRECLHCHANARSFEETSPHEDIREQLATNDMSCLTCHNKIHDADNIDNVKLWKGPGT
jgi:cytochrome c-type protein NapC